MVTESRLLWVAHWNVVVTFIVKVAVGLLFGKAVPVSLSLSPQASNTVPNKSDTDRIFPPRATLLDINVGAVAREKHFSPV